MKILIRLPNWLGDMVMSAAALRQMIAFYPEAELSFIVKKGLEDLLPFFPDAKHRFVFSKKEYSGLRGLWKFGKLIRQTEHFDLFVSFPNSFSSALMGYATGAKNRIGYRKEGREILLTHAYPRPTRLHRVEEYVQLLEKYTGKEASSLRVELKNSFLPNESLVININSEAQSRRLTTKKAVELISAVRNAFPQKIYLIGGPGEKAFVLDVFTQLPNTDRIEVVAGTTTLPQLAALLASAQALLTTDSGPAHLANALGTQTLVLFGAGNEANTAPYNQNAVTVVRLGQLSCEPCTKNVCVRFETPQCLERLDTTIIITQLRQQLHYAG